MSSGLRVVRKRKYVEEDVLNPISVFRLTEEQRDAVPKVGDIFIYNYTDKEAGDGRNRKFTDRRGCFKCVNDNHPKFIIAEEFRSGKLNPVTVCLLKSDFYVGLARIKIVDKPYYSMETTWEDFNVVNF